MIISREAAEGAASPPQNRRSKKCGSPRLKRRRNSKSASRNVSETNEKIIRLDRDLSVAIERMKNLA